VTEHAGPGREADQSRYGPLTRAWLPSFGVAVISALGALVLARLIVPVADAPVYSILVGAVVVAVWYGGFLPGVVALAIAWSLGPFLLVPEGRSSGLHSRDDLLRWGVPLLVALMIVWISLVMRRGQQRAATAAVVAEESSREMEQLQRLATALSAAVTPTDVAHALVEQTPGLLGARGGSVSLIEGDELVIVDPAGVAGQTHRPGQRLPIGTRAPIARAAAENDATVVHTREEFESRFPDGAAMTPYARGAVAVPLRMAGEAGGSMSFLFDRDDAVTEEATAIAAIAADLGGQALERAQLYDRERQSRRALDRVLRVAPRFHVDRADEASAAICREARHTFGSDLAELWHIREKALELEWREVEAGDSVSPPAERLELDALPGLRWAVDHLEARFVSPDRNELGGYALQYVSRLGLQSWLWLPIVAGERVERALLVAWHAVATEPDQSTLVLARRFADQAGLALEQIDRREAQAQAARQADRTRRLQHVTAALSQAATPLDVSNTCLEHAMAAIGADAGVIGFVAPGSAEIELVSARGYTDDELEGWRTFPLSTDVPLAAAIASGEAVWARPREELSRFAPTTEAYGSRHGAWIALPLSAGSGARGGIQLAFREPRELGEDDREWLLSLASQCAQALERSRLFDEERRLRRRSELLQNMTASLSGSITQLDVAMVAVTETIAAVDADAGAFAVAVDERLRLTPLAKTGYDDEQVRAWLDVPLDSANPATRAVRRRVSRMYDSLDEIASEFPEIVGAMELTGHQAFLFVPLVVGGTSRSVLVTSWAERTTLTDDERSFVQTLASLAAQAFERARQFESERTIAETLQRSVLPVSLPQVEGVRIAARYLPGTEEVDVGGDWFDAISLPNGRLGLVVGDVVGKGVQSAATMAQLRNALRAFALDQMKPSSTITRLNRLAYGVSDTAFATLVYAVVDPAARVCRFTAAGHPPPLAVYPDGRAEYFEGGRSLPLGAAPDTAYTQDVVELPVGATLLLYTDGLIERRNWTIDDGLRRLHAAAVEAPGDPERLVEHVLDTLVGAGDRRDDIAVLAVRLLVAAPEPLRLRLPSDLESLDVVRDALRVWLETAPVTASQAEEIVLATWETCANAIEHAQRPAEDVIRVTAELDQLSVRVCVEDTGTWAPETTRDDRGLGLRLVRGLMTSVDIETGERGTRIVLGKEIASRGELGAGLTSAT
jgi:serine phosphatase RsbU (regulator of sigma subunit)/anti-sigma regulatory factor (Ser/Thr protein kinase)